MNTMQHDDKPRRGRPPKERGADVSQPIEAKEPGRRRRKQSGPGVIGQRLGVNESHLDFDNFEYRWINEYPPARFYAKTVEDDWDVVKNNGGVIKPNSSDLGNAVSHISGVKPDGSPLLTYLCRKPKPYYQEDQQAKMEELDRQLAGLRRGQTRDGSAQGDYVPNSGIRID